MSKLPYGVLDITDDSIVFTKEYLQHHLETCEFAAKRSKEQGDTEHFSYYNGRAGVFRALLANWQYLDNDKGEI